MDSSRHRSSATWHRATLALCLMAVALGLGGCRERLRVPPGLQGDRLLTAPTASYLRTRLALVEAGRVREARDLWAMRSLLTTPPPDLDTQERYWWSQLGAAGERWRRGRQDAPACHRLALVLDNARWHAEALVMVRRALALDPGLEEARLLEHSLARLERFAHEADSTAATLRVLHAAGEVDARELVATVGALAGSYGYTGESLRRRGLYLGQREPLVRGASWEAELSVIVDLRGATTIRLDDGAVRVRRVIVDDDRLARPEIESGSPWLAEPGVSAQDGELTVYHPRHPHRRAGMLLHAALEHRAGAAPRELAALGAPIVATSPEAAGSTSGGAAASGVTGDPAASVAAVPAWIATLAAAGVGDALRLAAGADLFATARAAESDRDASRRRFIRSLMALRLEQIELRAARTYLDQRPDQALSGPQRREERLFVEVLAHGPLPRMELADLFDIAVAPDALVERGAAARAVLRNLRRTLNIDVEDSGDRWLAIDRQALWTAARAIADDRFGGG